MKGKLKDLTRNMDGTYNLTVSIGPDAKKIWDKLRDKDVEVEVKQFRQKRSLDASAFCWALCRDIGQALYPPLAKEEVYRHAIRAVGVYEPLPIREDALERFSEIWSGKGTGWFVDVVDDSKLKGYKRVNAYFGTSTYNSKEMSTLIDYLVDDAEQMGLPIPLGKDEVEKLKREWGRG